MSVSTDVRLPSYDGAEVVVAAPAPGPGNWAEAASCVLVDGTKISTSGRDSLADM